MTTTGTLQYQVHIAEPVPFDTTEKAPNGDPRIFQPISSTLIFGTSGRYAATCSGPEC